MSKRQYIKKEKIPELMEVDKKMFDALLKVSTKIKLPVKEK